MLILGIETSCDDTAAAVVADGRRVLSSVLASQAEVHGAFGGVVPELASRRHLETCLPVIHEALGRAGVTLAQVDAVAVTKGPGLAGSLLVGLAVAKGLAFARGLPLVGVNHIQAHLGANALEGEMEFPAVGLVVSGGHTDLYYLEADGAVRLLGRSRDDAVGEVLDKVAREMGLGYPGGAPLERLATGGRSAAYPLPRARLGEGSLDFSFSGLKTAAIQQLRKLAPDAYPDLAAALQEAAIDIVTEKTLAAAVAHGVKQIYTGGGVVANSRLRSRLQEAAEVEGLRVFCPSPVYCTDNAAMVAAAGYQAWQRGQRDGYDLNAEPGLSL